MILKSGEVQRNYKSRLSSFSSFKQREERSLVLLILLLRCTCRSIFD